MKHGVVEKIGRRRMVAAALCAALSLSAFAFAQQTGAGATGMNPARTYPKEIRGYKVELAKVELKKQESKETVKEQAANGQSAPSESDSLIQLGEPHVAGLSPLGITLEVPVTVAAVKQSGRVDFLVFEDMIVNGTRVSVNEYHQPFDLPNDRPATLPVPLSIYISTPRAMLGVLGEWNKPADLWPVTGRVYVFGQFKKFIFKFKRVVPVELDLTFKNPLTDK